MEGTWKALRRLCAPWRLERESAKQTEGGGRRGSALVSIGSLSLSLSFFALTLIGIQLKKPTNRPVAYAPAEKERSANANAIKFAADLMAGGVAGGISKTGAFG